jgi:hypothetical protein
MVNYLAPIAIIASVRTDGAIGEFNRRTFDLMLDQREPQDKQLREAIRILRQIGYETRGVQFAPNPGN